MEYKYSMDGKVHEDEISYIIKNSPFINKIIKRPIKVVFIVDAIAFVLFLISNVITNKYDRDFIYIFLEMVIIVIASAVFVLTGYFIYLKRGNKKFLKSLNKEDIHILNIKENKIYYFGLKNKKINLPIFSDKEIELNSEILKDVFVFKDSIGIVIGKKKNSRLNIKKNIYSIIIIPKNIFKSTNEFNNFKELIKNKVR